MSPIHKTLKALVNSDFVEHRYYIFGLALQKGVPFIIIPLITWYFGKLVYANYVLSFSLIQFIALLIGMGCTGAIIVFWHQYENKNQYLTRFLILFVFLHAISAIILYPFLTYYFSKKGIEHPIFLITTFIFCIFSYNFNLVCSGVLRAKMLSKLYFKSVFASSALFFILTILFGYLSPNLTALLCVLLITNLFQGVFFILASSIRLDFNHLFSGFFSFFKKIIGYSLPIMLYILFTLSLITVDKWLVKLNFSSKFFIEYTYNYQFSYAINVIGGVINMYNIPLFCQLLRDNQRQKILKTLKMNYLIVTCISIFLIFASYCYAHLSRIDLTSGFWIFSLAFLFSNLFCINVAFFEATKSSKDLCYSSLLPTVIFWAIFLIVIKLQVEKGVYIDFVLYYGWLTYKSMRFARTWFKNQKIDENSTLPY